MGALVMVSSAIYPGLTGASPAVLSPAVYSREIPTAGTAGVVTISDDLENATITSQRTPALRALQAGLDLLLYSDHQTASATAYTKLLTDLQTGSLSSNRVRDAYRAMIALKRQIAG